MKKKRKLGRRVLSFVLTLALVLGLMPGVGLTAYATTWSGEGTEESPYLISSLDNLKSLRDSVNGGTDYSGKYFKLTADIDCGTDNWVPIGKSEMGLEDYIDYDFKGTFDGNGKTVTYHVADSSDDCIGLFAFFMNGATVKNLSVAGSISGSGKTYGGIVGRNYVGTIQNCSSSVSITGSGGSYGGIAGTNDGTIDHCVASGALIWNFTGRTSSYAAGITAVNAGTVNNCVSLCDISAENVSTTGYAGRVIGRNVSGTVTDCYYLSTANITGNNVNASNATAKTADELKAIGETAYNDGYTVYALALGYTPNTQKAYADYDVTTDANKTKNGDDLTALQVKFNGKPWYIIEDNSTAINAGTVTLFAADTSFGLSKFHDSSNDYSNSTVKGVLDGLVGSGGSFADVADTIVTNNDAGGKLYLLSKTEAEKLPAEVLKIDFYDPEDTIIDWWLRTKGFGTNRGTSYRSSEGFYEYYGVMNKAGVRPALKLDLSKVTFYPSTKTFSTESTQTHSFTYEASGNTITATCADVECTLENKKATLTIAAPASLAYDGSAKAAVITDENHIQGTAKVQYQTKNGGSYGDATETAPTNPGAYKASITIGEGVGAATASVEYTITATPLTITGATLTSRAYAKDNKSVDVTAVTFDGGTPTIGTDYTATAEMADDTAGDSKDVTVTVTLINPNYSLAGNTYNTTVKISKAKPAKPAVPTAESITDTSVMLTATEGYQYKRENGGGWQDSNAFTGLTENTQYLFYQRVKGDTNHSDSDSSEALVIKTKQEPISYTVYSKSGNFIVITTKTITEYIKAQTTNNTVWLKDGDFYVVKGDVTLNKGLVYSGNVSILLCDDSKLTIKGGIWHYGSNLTIYGQDGQSGEIVVEGDKNITLDNAPSGIDASTISKDSALNGGKIHINGGKLSVTPGTGQNMCGTGATIDFLSNVSIVGTTEAGTETLTEGSYGAAELNKFTGFDAKPVATVTTAPEAKTQIYNGQAQELVTAGTATGGEMQYALGTATEATQPYTTSIPTATDAGTYYVWYKVIGDANHNDSDPDFVEAKINPVDKKDLNNAIEEAEEYYNTIKDNSDYSEQKEALGSAISTAKLLAGNDNATAADVSEGITAINTAKTTAETAVKAIIESNKKVFVAEKTTQKNNADALSEELDSDASNKLITDAKAAIDALTYDETKSLDENKAAIEAVITSLKTDLLLQRAEDFVTNKEAFGAYKETQKKAADSLAVDGDSDASKKLIEDAKKAIYALAYDETKSLDENKKAVAAILTKLKEDLTTQRAADKKETDDTAAAKKVTDAINALPASDKVATTDKVAIEAARKAYDALTAEQKAKVTPDTLKKLTDAEAALTAAEKKAAEEEADTKAANAVVETINKLPASDKVATTDKAAIEAARKAYDALTADQKKKVSADVLKKLTDAENALKAAEAAEKAAKELEAAKKEAQAAMNEQVTVKQKGKKFTVEWHKSESADGYHIYAQYCGKDITTPVITVTGNTTTKVTIKKINDKKISAKKNFRVYVVPYKMVNGTEVELGKSTVAHLVGDKNKDYSNVKKLKLKKSKYTMGVGETAKIEAKVKLEDKNKKHIPKSHSPKFRYISSDTGIATVDKKGNITGVKSGTCTVFVYSINGLVKKAEVTIE